MEATADKRKPLSPENRSMPLQQRHLEELCHIRRILQRIWVTIFLFVWLPIFITIVIMFGIVLLSLLSPSIGGVMSDIIPIR